tara:strand:+ start:281 stop:853 length:573 start_codon:yes stop_codon:yes gene_type:complete
MAYENSIRVLQGFAKKQVDDAKRNISQSKNLVNQIKSIVIGDFLKDPVVKFTMPKYAGFVDTGVKGVKNERRQLNSAFANLIFGFKRQPAFSGRKKMIPTASIDKWVVRKIKGDIRDDKGRFVSRRSLKFAIAKSIYKKGLGQGGQYKTDVGKGFFSKPLEQNLPLMYQNLEGAIAKDIKENLTKEEYFV